MYHFNPVFLVGPGRSGTTLLYKMLSLHPKIGFISHYDRQSLRYLPTPWLSRLVTLSISIKQWAWFDNTGNAYYVSRNWLRKLVPIPVEGENIFKRAGLTLNEYENAADEQVQHKLRNEIIRLQKYQASKALVIKRTANNRRIPCLAAAFPEAKYLLLLRDGRAVAASLTKVGWWNEHSVWWANHKTPLQMLSEGKSMLEIAARNWVEEMRCIYTGLRSVDDKEVLTVRYEDLISNPIEYIHPILQHIGVDPCVEHDLALRKLHLTDREAWRTWNDEEMDLVMSIQAENLRKYGYTQ
jgi:hypothetical protein